MEAVFLKILNMSITASWIALAVIAVRLLLKKAPKWITVLMWGLVGIRLVCPFSLESIFSLIPSAETVPGDILYTNTPTIHSGVEAFNSVVNPIILDSLAPAAGASVHPIRVIAFAASAIWIVGIVAMFTYTVVSYIRIYRKVKEAVPYKDNIRLCDHVDTPFILGVIHPKIYLPSAMSEQDMKYVIAHENTHLKRHDHWWKPLGFLLLTVYWFHPILWVAYVLLCRDIELACDEKVIQDMGTENKKPYSDALINCSAPRRMIAACPLAFGEVGVKERVKSVLNYRKPAFWIIVAAMIAGIVLAVCFLTNPAESTEFGLSGNNVSDIDPENIVSKIQKIEGLDDETLYINSDVNGFGLYLDSDFNWSGSQTIQYFFKKGSKTYGAQLRIFQEKNTCFVTDSSKLSQQKTAFLLYYYLQAVKFLPQEAIRQIAPADRYILRQIEEGTPSDYSKVITYSSNGVGGIDGWYIHLQLEPLHEVNGAYQGTGDEVIQLFFGYADGSLTAGGNDTLQSVRITLLREQYPQYFDLDAANGLDVYVWQMAENRYSFGVLPHSDTHRDSSELLDLRGTGADAMRQILSTYHLDENDIHIIPWQNPISSYIGEQWIAADGESIEEKQANYVDTIEDMLFGEQAQPPDYGYPIYDSLVFDIDGDGIEEYCVLGYGRTSGIFTFSLTAGEAGAEQWKYNNVFCTAWYNLSFVRCDDGVVRVQGIDQTKETHLFDISVIDGNLQLSENGKDISMIKTYSASNS